MTRFGSQWKSWSRYHSPLPEMRRQSAKEAPALSDYRMSWGTYWMSRFLRVCVAKTGAEWACVACLSNRELHRGPET